MSLKTLYDLKIARVTEELKSSEEGKSIRWKGKKVIDAIELQDEAIVWLKELEKGNSNWEYVPKDIEDFVESYGDDCSPTTNKLMCWIKHFFHLTEKDLK